MNQLTHPTLPVFLVDDEPHILLGFSTTLRAAGISHILTIEDSREVMPLLEEKDASIIVLDLSMPHVSGNELLDEISRKFPHVPVVIVTAMDDIETAVECMKGGAFDYLVKPVEMNRFLSSIKKALELSDLRQEVSSLKNYLLADQLEPIPAFSSIITNSKKMRALLKYVEAIAGSQQPVLITGETGVGKELIARSIHDLSAKKGEFIAVNIAGLDDTMFSDALFGHKRGAYTGAEREREGLIAQAAGGTLFLDEIGDLHEASQVKLLRLLQDQKFFPLGSDTPRTSSARVVVATNQDIQRLMKGDRFRKDLYYRLCAHQVHIPPLRERIEDIPLLLNHFLDEAAISFQKKKPSYPEELITLLSAHHFPGNIRELQAMAFDAVAQHTRGILSMASFKKVMGQEHVNSQPVIPSSLQELDALHCAFSRFPTLKEVEDYFIGEALKRSHGNQGAAAFLLGITRQALNKRLTRRKKGLLPGNSVS